ncbi:MAG: hypothetical protein HYT08_04495 [Candidatus Levybacteria bacterium]|nr:hypothetical protein [Candidatus Levybacteria bacterium]
MIDKELSEKRSRNPLKRLAKLAVPVIAAGMALSDNNTAKVNEAATSFPSDTPAQLANLDPSLTEEQNQVVPIDSQELASFKQSISERLGVEIQTFDEISQHPQVKLFYGFQNIIPVNQEWNEDNLRLLENVFGYIPEDFYEVRDGEKVHVILGPSSHCGYDIKGFTPKYPYEVMLSYQLFMPERPLTAALVATHEFGHLKTTESCNSPLGPNYIDQIEEILGEDFAKTQEELPEQIDRRASELEVKVRKGGLFTSVDSLTPEKEESFRLTRLNYAAKNSKEFIAVGFESYFMGRNYFERMYEPFFGKSKTGELYDMIKNIYQGKEFPDYHITEKELQK